MIKIGILLVFMLSQISLFAQNEVQDTNQFAIKAIRQAVMQYHQQKHVGYYKYMVITMKIMRINKTSGEFVLNYIVNDDDYDNLHPTHYVHVANELVLIIVDSKRKADPVKFGLSKTTAVIKAEALRILAGPNLVIGGQGPPYMIFKYKKDKLKCKFYLSYPPLKSTGFRLRLIKNGKFRYSLMDSADLSQSETCDSLPHLSTGFIF